MIKERKRILLDLLSLMVGCITIIIFWQYTTLISIILLIISVSTFFYNSKSDIIYFIIVAISATIIEAITISTGAWIYSVRNVVNVPIWIPLYWGLGALTMNNIHLLIKNKVK